MMTVTPIPPPKLISWSNLLTTYVISVTYAVLAIPVLLLKALYFGPSKFFDRRLRAERPSCLNDPTLGKHRVIQLDDVTIHCLDSGGQDKPLMLFLHGFPQMWYSWQHQIREFSKDHRTVAVDMRGYGESSKPHGVHNYHINVLANDVTKLIQVLGYKSCILVAHDWGGKVAQYVAGLQPDMVDKLIVCNNAHPEVLRRVLRSSIKQFVKSWYTFFFQIPYLPEIALSSQDIGFIHGAFSSKKYSDKQLIDDETIEAYKYSLGVPGGLTGPLNYYRAAGRYQAPALPSPLPTPTLMVWGVHDLALTTTMATESVGYYINCTLKFVDDAGHWVQEEKSETVNKYMREFLQKNSAQENN